MAKVPTLSLLHLTESAVRTKSQNEIKDDYDHDSHDNAEKMKDEDKHEKYKKKQQT
jgi:hypothetical protein